MLSVKVEEALVEHIVALVGETRNDPRLQLGASPRASMALYRGGQALAALRGRDAVEAADIRELAPPVLLKSISIRSEHLLKNLTEEKVIAETLDAALRLDYPRFEVVVVDDGSTDGTVLQVMPYVERGKVRLVRKTVNEGKAMALNDALPCLNGEIVLTLDADALADPDTRSKCGHGKAQGTPQQSHQRPEYPLTPVYNSIILES